MAKFLVTGVAGFIGARVADSLLQSGHEVVGIDNLSTGFIEAIPTGAASIINGAHEVGTIEKLNDTKFDAILHIAGQSGGEMSYEDPVYDLQSNAQSTLLLLDYAVRTGCKRIVYASTVSVYGENGKMELLREDDVTFPKSFYGVGKLASENYLRIYSNQFNLDTFSLRLFNIYGPGQNLKNLKQGMVSIFLSQAIKDKHIHVKGAPERFRDLVYIDDCVDAFKRCLDVNLGGYNVMNVATGKKTSVREVTDGIIEALQYDVLVEFSGSTPGDVHGYTGDNSKIRSLLGWKPTVSRAEGIKRMVKWAIGRS